MALNGGCVYHAINELNSYMVRDDVEDIEKKVLVRAFSDLVGGNVLDNDKSDLEIDAAYRYASSKCIDSRLKDLGLSQPLNSEQLNQAIKLVQRQNDNFDFLRSNEFPVRITDYSINDPSNFLQKLQNNYDNNKLLVDTLDLEKRILRFFDKNNYITQEEYLSVFPLIDDYSDLLNKCKKNGVDLSKIQYSDSYKLLKDAHAYKTTLAERDELYNRAWSIDKEITLLENTWFENEQNPRLIKQKCDELASIIGTCRNRQFILPRVNCQDPNDCVAKYKAYIDILKMDGHIQALSDPRNRNELEKLKRLCAIQEKNYALCKSKNWDIPFDHMKASNIAEVVGRAENSARLEKEAKMKKIKSFFMKLGLIAFLFFIVITYAQFMLSHSKMPFSSGDVVGEKYKNVVNELEDAGFSNIVTKEVDSGIVNEGRTVAVLIDGNDVFQEDKYVAKEEKIVVQYASEDRIEISDMLNDWDSVDYRYLIQELAMSGFNVKTEEVASTDSENNYKVVSLNVNGVDYTSGRCYVPEGCKITVNIYGLAIRIGSDPDEFIGEDYEDVWEDLMDMGFENIEFERTDDLLIGFLEKDKSVESITINGESEFDEDDEYSYDAEIIITVNTFESNDYYGID
ncbi:MAG: hypothetical protein IJ869_05860 [Clostridiales bacterium]|nr:hypothetical protein [Clostridiales bacterium]